jgi:flagellar basal-body rod protein FlgF
MAGDISDIASAAERLVTKLENVTNNLANASTIGFKEEFLRSISENDLLNQQENQASSKSPMINMSQGMIQQTGNALDVAIDGEGFFTIQTKDGEAYTRKGNFHLNKSGEIVTSAGEPVLGDRGTIVAKGKEIKIDQQGLITVDGGQIGKLKIVTFDQPKMLERAGNGVYSAPATAGVKVKQDPQLITNSVELSNVNAVQQMVTMIEIQRTMETYQKLIQTITDQDRIATTRVGKLM